MYEAATLLILFLILLAIWYKYRARTPEGLLLGIFLIWAFGLRWAHETFKENQVSFEDDMPFNMGQILSIPMILLGIVVLFKAFQNYKKMKAIS